MTNRALLISDLVIPKHTRDSFCLADKYEYLKRFYLLSPANSFILDNREVFAPFPEPNVPWDISDVEKIIVYNKDVAKVLKWIQTKIVINLGCIDYKTLDVLIRIATGMLNKCDIPKDIKIMLHENMVKNLRAEHNNIILSTLPF